MGNTVSSLERAHGEDENAFLDDDLVWFDNDLKQRAEDVVTNLEADVKSGGIGFSSLKSITSHLYQVNQNVVDFILSREEDVWANDELKELISEYFSNSGAALEFCLALEACVEAARDNQLLTLKCALSLMPEDTEPTKEQCMQVIEELQKFREAEDPFSTRFPGQFDEVLTRQRELQQKLLVKKRKLDKKLALLAGARAVTTVIMRAAYVSLFMCTAVVVAIAAPVAGGFVTAPAIPVDSANNWLNKLWDKYENKIHLELRRSVVEGAYKGTYVFVSSMESIRCEVEALQNDITAIYKKIDLGLAWADSISVQIAVKRIKYKEEEFSKSLDLLQEHVGACHTGLIGARLHVLQKLSSRMPSNHRHSSSF